MKKNDPSISTRESFHPRTRRELAGEIAAAGGNEVFFLGTLSEEGILADVEVVARGNAGEVPVFLDRAGEHQVLIHNHPGGDLTPSPEDLSIAAEAGARRLGFFIIDDEATRVYRVVEPFPSEEEVPLDEEEIASAFSAGGLLAGALPSFEDRPGQRQMAIEVARSFNRGEVVAFEAGTGVGKSYAYLVPAILWAVRNEAKVVISTHTIPLGEQLIAKDLPQLTRVLEVPFTYALIKGRGNYACRRKTAEVEREPGLFAEDGERENWLAEILERLKSTGEGSRSILPREPPDDLWHHFASTTEQSLKTRCPHYRECFYYEARRRAFGAHIVVVNHHLFFTDLAVRRALGRFDGDLVIPAYRRVIFDEAHRLEEVASQHLGIDVSRLGILQGLGRMAAPPRVKGRKERGRFPYLAALLRQKRPGRALEHLEMELLPRVKMARERVQELFGVIRERILEVTAPEGDAPGSIDGGMVRVGSRPDDLPLSVIEKPLGRLRDEAQALAREVRKGLGLLQDEPFEPEERFEGAAAEYRGALRTLDEHAAAIDVFLAEEKGMVPWLELGQGRRQNLRLRVAPLRVSEILAENLYRPAASVVMTSATLSVAGEWEFLGDRLGWSLTEEGRFRGETFASPFDFHRQVMLALPEDIPPPGAPRFIDAFCELLIEAVRVVRGRTFVLFTSHAALREVARRVGPALGAEGFPALVQGTAPRAE
ncbi:MAG: hypothetical protein ACE5GW_11215, partial [Planctomycetota bacterium]